VADARKLLQEAVAEHVSADVLHKLVGELSDARYVCLGTEASRKNYYKKRAALLEDAVTRLAELVKEAWEGGSATAHNATVEGYYHTDDTFDESEFPAEVAKLLETAKAGE
jgi:hypothetical protein